MAHRISIITAGVLALLLSARIGSGQGATYECETGCYSIWTGWPTGLKYTGADPYTCQEGDDWWGDVDETGDCVPVDQNGPDPDVFYYSCDTCYPWCNNCPGGDMCLQVCHTGTQACPTPLGSQDRYECTGGGSE
jgi:hypothetical protein